LSRSPEPHRLDFEPYRFNPRVKLDRLDAPFGGSELLRQLARLIKSIAELGKPTCPLRRGICIRYSIHFRSPAVIRCSLPHLVRFALSPVRSGAEFV